MSVVLFDVDLSTVPVEEVLADVDLPPVPAGWPSVDLAAEAGFAVAEDLAGVDSAVAGDLAADGLPAGFSRVAVAGPFDVAGARVAVAESFAAEELLPFDRVEDDRVEGELAEVEPAEDEPDAGDDAETLADFPVPAADAAFDLVFDVVVTIPMLLANGLSKGALEW